jgi:predicted amidohydrolase
LPELGLDKFVTPGDELPVFETRLGKIAILICFDQRHPEAMRVLMLKGAQLVALPTNWPVGAECSAEYICIARASENRIFLATCNRVGHENGFDFIGRSKILGLGGEILSSAGATEETLLATIDLNLATNKRMVAILGKYETTVDVSRRPVLYENLVEPIG